MTTALIIVATVLMVVWVLAHKLVLACDAANEADWGGPWLNRLDGLNRIMCFRYHHLQADHIPLPDSGAALLVCNHISGLDPFLVGAAVKRPLRFMIAREEYERWYAKWLFKKAGCIPVDRSTRPETAFREALKTLKAGEVIAMFPHGGIHLPDDPPRRLKGGAVKLSQLTGAVIYPVTVSGIAAMGETTLALLRRSQARLSAAEPFSCKGQDYASGLKKMTQILDK